MPIAERLVASPAFAATLRALPDPRGVWIVGGALRDALVGREVTDLDLAVAEAATETARALAREAPGHAFELSGEFGTWRVAARDGWHVDVSTLRGGSIESDLGHRDFTLNAMALPLDRAGDDDAVLDPHGGRSDIEARTLRVVSERSFADDPLRLMRAARLAAELSFEIEPRTIALAREDAQRASEPAGERQLTELRGLLGGADPLRGMRLLDNLAVTAAVLPELETLRGVVQTPNHHLDVFDHTLEVLTQLLEIERDLPAYVGPEHAAEVEGLLGSPLADELSRRTALRFGALFHDLGKPATREERGGFVTFIGHDREGAEITRQVCERLRTSRRLADYLAGISLNHLRLGFLVPRRPLPRRTVYEYLRATDPDSVDVTLLTVADRLSARGTGTMASEAMIAGHLELAREMVAEALEWRRGGGPRSPIPGDELANALGLEPGPELGRLLAEIEAAVFAGEVTSREQAIEHAREHLSG